MVSCIPTHVSRKTRPRNGGPTVRVGDRIRLYTPDNPRLHETKATIVELTAWGAHCKAPAAASGQFRATWEEMILDVQYTGECCAHCGSMSMIQSGTCKTCQNCGESGGCA